MAHRNRARAELKDLARPCLRMCLLGRSDRTVSCGSSVFFFFACLFHSVTVVWGRSWESDGTKACLVMAGLR